jgi:DNA repair protein RadC
MSTPPLRLIAPDEEGRDARTLLDRRRTLEIEGSGRLSDAELLALALGRLNKGADPIQSAHQLLTRAGGLRGLLRLSPRGLRKSHDLSGTLATRLVALLALGRRASQDALLNYPRRPLTCSEVEAWARPKLAGLEHEEVWVLGVDARSTLTSTRQVGRGGMHGCGLLPRDILTPVVRDAAAGFVLVHNHPSGDPSPSQEDIELTRVLQNASASLCIPLIDHVIVAREGARSFFELGLLETL